MQHSKIKCAIAAQALLLAVSFSAPALAGPPAKASGYGSAVAEYRAKHYTTAIQKFNAVLKANPSNAMSHYYLALCYQATNQTGMAKAHYTWIADYSKDPGLRYNATYALAHMGPLSTVSSSDGSSSSSASGEPPPITLTPSTAKMPPGGDYTGRSEDFPTPPPRKPLSMSDFCKH